MSRSIVHVLTLSALVFVASGLPPVSAAAPTKGAMVEGITEYRLPNGLRVLLFPDPGKPTITVNITYLVGSRNENYGETGMAHLLEHMLFKGTPTHPDIPKELTEHGARSNGQTSFDRTNYFETFQATDENLRWALGMEADRMVHSWVGIDTKTAAAKLKTEMTVVRNEFESGENRPGSVLYKRMLAAAYDWHNYGKPTIGNRSDIENVDIERLSAFFKKYYQPDNAVLFVGGRIDEAKTLQAVSKFFGPIRRPDRVLPVTYTQEPVQDGEREVIVRRSGDVQIVYAGYHAPAGSDPDFGPIAVLTQILGDTPTGRLYKALVESKKATAVFADPMQLKEPSFIFFGLQAGPETSIEGSKEILLKALEDKDAMTFSVEEVDRAKQQILKETEMVQNDVENLGTTLSDYIAMGDWRLFFLDRDRVKSVTPEDVARVAKAYLKPSNRTLAMFIPTANPDRANIPSMQDVTTMVKGYRGNAAASAGEAFDTSANAIEAHTIRYTAPNGLRMAMVPKKTRGNTVTFRLVLRMGDEQSLKGKAAAGELTAEMLLRGTTEHSRIEISDLLDKFKAKLIADGMAESVAITGETNREHLPDVIKLVAEVLKHPAFAENEFEIARQEALAKIDHKRTDPSRIGELALTRHMSAYPVGHPRYVPSLDEEAEAIKKLTVQDLKDFYQQFYGASFAELAMVGDMDTTATQNLVGSLLGDWKSPSTYTRMPRLFKAAEATHEVIRTPDKANAFFMAGMNLPLQSTDPDYPAMTLADFMLGGGFLNSRLATRIRQKEGLSYSVGSELQAAAREQAGEWLAYAIYAPQNGEKLEKVFHEEMENVLKNGFTNEEIRAAKKGWLEDEQLNRADDSELVYLLGINLDTKRTMAYTADLEQKIQALTGEQILAALRKYIDPSKLSIVMAGDFSKAQ
jgi:zinc protease